MRDGLEPGDSIAAEGFRDGGKVAFGLVALPPGEDGAGVAEPVEAIGEGVVLTHGCEDGVGPVVGKPEVDASDLVVAPLVRCCPATVLSDRRAGSAGDDTVGAELF